MERFPENPNAAQEKLPNIRELILEEPDAVFLLTGALKFNDKKGYYESGSFQDKDENSGLATGGKDRMLAAAEIYRVFPKTTIVSMSRTRSAELPTYAAVMKNELERKGVSPESIVTEEESVDTISSFKQAALLRQEHGWNKLVFLTSGHHLPRSQALFNHLENFADTEEEIELLTELADGIRQEKISVQFISSDEVLSSMSPHYKALFNKVKNDPGIEERLALEQKALAQINAGTYGKYTLIKKIYPDPSPSIEYS